MDFPDRVELDDETIDHYSHGEYREMSWEKSRTEHLPQLNLRSDNARRHTPRAEVVLLGDGKIARMSTLSPSSSPWPSEQLILPADAAAWTIAPPLRRPGVFNAGVVGDGVMNLIYRLQGRVGEQVYQNPRAPNTPKTPELESLFKALLSKRHVKLWVVHIGANDLLPAQRWDPFPLYVLLELLFRNSNHEAKVLLTGLFYAANVTDDYVYGLNREYMRAVQYFAGMYGAERIRFLPAPREYNRKVHLAQGPHLEALCNEDLNLAGYQMWMRHLVPEMWEMMQPTDPGHGTGHAPCCPKPYAVAASRDTSDEERQPLLGSKDSNGTEGREAGRKKHGSGSWGRIKGVRK